MANEELQMQLAETKKALDQANAVIQWMETSKFWKLRLTWLRLRDRLKLQRRRSIRPLLPAALFSVVTERDEYALWRQKNSPRPADLKKLAETIDFLPHQPLISVVMPVFNTPELFLKEAIESVIGQIYPYWELCIADDASTFPYVKRLLERYQTQDSRIKVTFRDTNGHISNCSNSALELATGEFVAFLDHDDLLTPDALYEVALLINRQPTADMIYSDEDKVDEQGQLKDPFFKPDWCPDSFLSRMYTCHLGIYRRTLVTELGGFRTGFEGSQDYDLVLRLSEKTEEIFHIPKILYHWRAHANSTAGAVDNKDYSVMASKRALESALQRRESPGKVVSQEFPPYHHIVRYEIRDFRLVSIIIPTKDLGSVLERCLNSIFTKTIYPSYEVLVIDNGSIEPATFSIFNRWREKEPKRFRYQSLDIPFNYSRLNNYAVEQCQGDYLLFLNNDTEVITSDWIDAMVEQAQRPSIGAVGARLLYPDGTLQHGGVVAGIGGVAGHSHKHSSANALGYFNQIQTINNYSAVTAACLMCRRDIFKEVEGFDENLAVAFNDVDFCFKVVSKGYRNIYLPHVSLYHHESKSRGDEDTSEKQSRFRQEITYVQDRWGALIKNDPCYSPHLTREREDYSFNF